MNPDNTPERRRKILLVEDEEVNRQFIQRFLEREGHEVVAVDAAEEGIVEAAEQAPDVLISDIHLPGLSGIELASFLLAQDPGLPVILMTGDPDEGLARRALACGPVQYLLKPFEWFEMEAAVGFALQQRGTSLGGGPPSAESRVKGEPRPAPAIEEGGRVPDDAAGARPDADREARLKLESDWGLEAWAAASVGECEVLEPFPAVPEEECTAVWLEPEPIEEARAPADDGVAQVEIDVLSGDEAPLPAAVAGPGQEQSLAEAPLAGDARDWLDEVDRVSWAGPGHGDRVSRLVLALHRALNDPASVDAHELALAARVHEVGRLHVRDGDPVKLAVRGAEVLEEAGFPPAVTETVRHMQERWDGTSGPERLSGARIPQGAQLLAVADALDHYAAAWLRSGLQPEESAARAMNLVTVQQNLAFSPPAVAAMHAAAESIRGICIQAGTPDSSEPVPIPALPVREAVPFALFAGEAG